MPSVRQAVIMVGGKGTRLYPLTENMPKPVLPVLDKPCLKYLIRSFASAGITDIILACGYKSDILRKEIGDGSDLGVTITYSEEDEPRGTGGAIKMLEDRLDPVFAAANGDTFVDIDLNEQIKEHFRVNAKITIALTQVSNPCEFGIARIVEDGRIVEFKDKPKPEEVFSNYINSGIYIVDRSVLVDVPPNSFFDFSKDLVPIITNRGERIQGYRINGGVWRDVGRPADLIGANLIMAERNHTVEDFSVDGCEITGPFYLGKDSCIAASKSDSSVIHDSCTVSDSKLEHSLILSGCTVKGATLVNSILGKGCIVKEGAFIQDSVLRDGTVVECGERITKD